MSQNINQIFIANPASSMLSTDLYYLGRSPFGATNDMAITWANVMSSITVVGTIATGVWQGTAIGVIYGGTGLTSTTANQLLYSSSNNVIAGLATANNGTLITSAGGVPSISSTLPTAVQGNITQLGAQSQALNMNTHQINNVTDPTLSQDAATKNYVDTVAQGLNILPACTVATTGALTVTYNNGTAGVGATLTNAGAQAALSIDSVSLSVNDVVLVKNQASALQNGIYTVTNIGSGATNWVMTRATYYNTPAQINPGDMTLIDKGTVNAATSWIETATVTLVGTDSISFSQFGAAFPISLANGGTSASLTASNGGIFYSTASAGAILSGTSTAGQVLTSGASTTPAWTTTTYPLTNAINTIMYASSANVLGVITPANSSVLTSNGSGVPSWNTSLPAGTGINVTMTQKQGTGNNTPYTTSSASFAKLDATNLQYTVTIPTGSKLDIVAVTSSTNSGNAIDTFALFDGVTELVENQSNAGTSGKVGTLCWQITGDGASHTISLQFKTSVGTLSVNNSSTCFPVMKFMLMPSS